MDAGRVGFPAVKPEVANSVPQDASQKSLEYQGALRKKGMVNYF